MDCTKGWQAAKGVCLFVLYFYVQCSTLPRPLMSRAQIFGSFVSYSFPFFARPFVISIIVIFAQFIGEQNAISMRLSLGTRLYTTT